MTIQDVYTACEIAYAQTIKNTLALMLRDTAYCSKALTKEEEGIINQVYDWFDAFERKHMTKLSNKRQV